MITYTEMVAKDAHKQVFNNNYRYGGVNKEVLYERLKMAKEREVARALSLIDPDNFRHFWQQRPSSTYDPRGGLFLLGMTCRK